jgi:hypothetical protein
MTVNHVRDENGEKEMQELRQIIAHCASALGSIDGPNDTQHEARRMCYKVLGIAG